MRSGHARQRGVLRADEGVPFRRNCFRIQLGPSCFGYCADPCQAIHGTSCARVWLGPIPTLAQVGHGRYVDDLFRCDDGRKAPAAKWATAEGVAELVRIVVSELLGWALDEAKSVQGADSTVVLGVRAQIAKSGSGMFLPSDRVRPRCCAVSCRVYFAFLITRRQA